MCRGFFLVNQYGNKYILSAMGMHRKNKWPLLVLFLSGNRTKRPEIPNQFAFIFDILLSLNSVKKKSTASFQGCSGILCSLQKCERHCVVKIPHLSSVNCAT